MSVRSHAARASLLLVPAVSLALMFAFLEAKGPFWLGYNTDPDYAYLLNSADVARGLRPNHVGHPGTFVQVLGAAVLRATHAAVGQGDLAADVVGRPELYLRSLCVSGMVLCALGALLVGLAVHAVTGRLVAATLAQLTPFLSATIPAHVACVKPEPIQLALACALGALAVWVGGDEPRRRSMGVAAGLAMVCGAAVASKVTAVPLLVLPLLLLSGRARLVFLPLAVAGFALFTLPAGPNLRHMFSLSKKIASHQGQYGSGLPGILDAGTYARALVDLVRGELLFVLALTAGALAVAVDRCRPGGGSPAVRRALVAVLAAQLGCLLLVARHPYNEYLVPGVYYLVPGLGLTGTALALGYALLVSRVEAAPRRAQAAILLVALVTGAMLGAVQVEKLAELQRRLAQLRDWQLEVSTLAENRYPGRVVYYYRSSSRAYALKFGDYFAGGHYRELVAATHPRAIFYDVWARKFEPRQALAGAGTDPAPFAMQGTPLSPQQVADLPIPARPEMVYRNEREALYELRFVHPDAR